MTRRLFTISFAGLPAVVAFGEEMRDRDTAIELVDAEPRGEFLIGVRTTVKASHYLAEVFYKANVVPAGELLLHQESFGPVAGNESYGATNRNFTCPRDKIAFIRVTFFQKLDTREFRK